jgi:hypothetical protein
VNSFHPQPGCSTKSISRQAKIHKILAYNPALRSAAGEMVIPKIFKPFCRCIESLEEFLLFALSNFEMKIKFFHFD